MKFYSIKNTLPEMLNFPLVSWPRCRKINKQPKFSKLAAQANMCIMELSEI